MQFARLIQPVIEKRLFRGKIIIVYGARRVGKTTLVKKILSKHKGLYLNCDEPDVRRALTDKTSTELKSYLGRQKLVVIDEAQRVVNIGLTLKLIADNAPKIQIIATGSSSFDLSNKIKEPLTGRAVEFHLAPLFLREISKQRHEAGRLLATRLIYGMYPEVIVNPSDAAETLRSIYRNYLYKDALEYQGVKNPQVVEKLLTALALQIGNQVSFTELSNLLGIDQKTVSSYVRLLELAFVVFRLPPLSRNLRKEISKSRKIYFWDTGVRNTVINNFNPLSLRQDTGQLWENFIISERTKRNEILRSNPNRYFWRTWDRQEIDYVEEEGGQMKAFEIKWQKEKKKPPKVWKDTYPQSGFHSVTKENYWEFLKI